MILIDTLKYSNTHIITQNKKVIYVNDKSELVENKIDNIQYIKSENKIVTQWFKIVSKYNTHIRNFRTNI
jgi:hypothetical protein